MDIISHAIAGASVGHYYGSPTMGAVLAILPDMVLPMKRQLNPPPRYMFSHSMSFLAIATLFGHVLNLNYELVYYAISSHIILDYFTHCKQWSPRLFYPYTDRSFGDYEEWEWFNTSWCIGFTVTIIWSLLWLIR